MERIDAAGLKHCLRLGLTLVLFARPMVWEQAPGGSRGKDAPTVENARRSAEATGADGARRGVEAAQRETRQPKAPPTSPTSALSAP